MRNVYRSADEISSSWSDGSASSVWRLASARGGRASSGPVPRSRRNSRNTSAARQLGRRDLVEQTRAPGGAGFARCVARRHRPRQLGRLGRLGATCPHGGWIGDLYLHVLDPGLDVKVQQIRPVGKPALALGREREQHVLEPAERALAVDGHQQALAQRRIRHGRRRTAPSSGTARATTRDRRVGIDSGLVGHLGATSSGVRLALDDREQVAVLEVEEALLVGRVAFERRSPDRSSSLVIGGMF